MYDILNIIMDSELVQDFENMVSKNAKSKLEARSRNPFYNPKVFVQNTAKN